MAWGKRCGITILILLFHGVASAVPAGDAGFVPISVGPASGAEQTVVVEPGDHLWKISQTRLDDVLGRRAGVDEVAPYWLTLIAANRDRLRSGDPDLIFPGEVIVLPEQG